MVKEIQDYNSKLNKSEQEIADFLADFITQNLGIAESKIWICFGEPKSRE